MTDKTEKLGVNLTAEEKRQFRIEAAKRETTMSELARQILMEEGFIGESDDAAAEGNRSRTPTATAD
jgi:hypothetical protein